MRQLHSVAYHERFTASGTYVYEQNGRPAGITEAWTIHTLPDDSQRIRVDYDARNIPSGTSILLEALSDSAGNIQRFDVRLDNKSVKLAKASYMVFDDHIQIGRQINDQPLQDEVLFLPSNTVIYPLMNVFAGSVIRQIIAYGGKDIPVFLPIVTHPNDNQILSGIIEQHSASIIDTQPDHTQRYHFVGGNYNELAVFWLDQSGLLTAYEYQSWRVRLKNLARSNTFA